MARTAAIIASTFGWDIAEVRESRYQDTRTKQPLFVLDGRYYTTSKDAPKDKEYDWKQATDQFWAKQSDTILWVADTQENDEARP
jgi:hypothetical protein